MKYPIRFFGFLLFFLMIAPANAAMSPLGISVFPPVQFPSEPFTVAGARVNLLWGSHMDVYGIDVGVLGNITAHDMIGVQVAGLMNWNKGDSTAIGLQLAGLANMSVNKAHLVGVQAAGILNYNHGEGSDLGVIVAPVNLTEFTKVMGLEVGLYNIASEVYGFQIGLINKTQRLHGIQIGVLNFNREGLFAVAPALNVGF